MNAAFFQKASWTPSETEREAPSNTFLNEGGGHGIQVTAPWALNRAGGPPPPPNAGGMPTTRAPWAK